MQMPSRSSDFDPDKLYLFESLGGSGTQSFLAYVV
jgi:hypothetical protein